ncbi:ammonium transporter [Methanomassiliicoccus luminyensis]|jgi:ammonia channel protein AmtB|uniref:ammonium transporter n=1 Tax=Methanomassiliicoccus luminyensis TaxID=1080712 RepID=UPI00037DE697|nr:ammonium transporter [Methanomassiliicoccus luminyensis]
MVFDTGETTWMLVSTVLVLIMTLHIGFLYGGVLKKNDERRIGADIAQHGESACSWGDRT